ncbi:aquaporin [Protomyces lactucae-debilis]|uniref:Aquaporin n=1 Tax=Protomyces lactucae-debilis TaxID=2754530 RepID=A0A1Y2FGU2_PROLT|nr:aquaporin [Protomyces lactucae-debilis]ORY83161.1 aquaporin [Protomyces lactucae-debilis]
MPSTGIADTRVADCRSDTPSPELSNSTNHWARFRSTHREVLAEFLATTILICIGQASTLQSTLDPDGSNKLAALSYGIGVMLSIYVAGSISDAHLNPAITVALAVFRGFPKRRILGYVVAQVMGAVAGCSIAYGVYSALGPTASQLVTAPTRTSYVCAFFNEFVASAIFMAGFLAISDVSNCPPVTGTDPFIIALIIAVLGFSFGYPMGPSLNPIRDFAPRVIAACVTLSGEVFTMHHYWFLWGGILAPILGCLFGSLVYDLFVFTGAESPINWHYGKSHKRHEDEQAPV